jgi:hypothetical protein
MTNHLRHRLPAKAKRGLSWGRSPRDDGSVLYRLFRRDASNRVHQFCVVISPGERIEFIRAQLRDACRRIRDQVDEIDLAREAA